MNRSKIEFVDYTWNPITGYSNMNSSFRYIDDTVARFSGDIRMNKSRTDEYEWIRDETLSETVYMLEEPMFNEGGNIIGYPFGTEPTYHRYRVKNPMMDKLKNGANIMVCAMGDILDYGIPYQWANEVIKACDERPNNNYLFLTDGPRGYTMQSLPTNKDNFWFGTIVHEVDDLYRISHLKELSHNGYHTFVLFDVDEEMSGILHDDITFIEWVVIGIKPSDDRTRIQNGRMLVGLQKMLASNGIFKYYMLDSVKEATGIEHIIKDYPDELKHKKLSNKMQNKLYGQCAICKKNERKADMVKLSASTVRGESAKQYALMCKNCFRAHCIRLDVALPDIKGINESDME